LEKKKERGLVLLDRKIEVKSIIIITVWLGNRKVAKGLSQIRRNLDYDKDGATKMGQSMDCFFLNGIHKIDHLIVETPSHSCGQVNSDGINM
jgi:hypothetical protein